MAPRNGERLIPSIDAGDAHGHRFRMLSLFPGKLVRWTLIFWAAVYVLLTIRSFLNPQPFAGFQAALRFGSVLLGAAISLAIVPALGRLHDRPFATRALAIALLVVTAHAAWTLGTFAIFYLAADLWQPKYGAFAAISSNFVEFVWLFPAVTALYLLLDWTSRSTASRRKAAVLWASDRGTSIPVPVRSIQWFQSEGDYVRIQMAGKSHLIRATLTSLERRTRGMGFLRIHRRFILDLKLAERLKRQPDGRLKIILRTGDELPIGRRYLSQVREALSASAAEGS